jgi:hypothetical protein
MSHSTNASATAAASSASATAATADTDPTHCSICADHYTAVLRKKVECSFCHKATCSKCVENYLMSRHEDAHCLHCRVNYSDATLRGICTQTYLKNKYYKHRQEVLMNRERAALPGLQDTALAAKKTRDDMKEANEVHKTLLEMRRERKTHLIAYHQVNMEYHQLHADRVTERAALRLQLDEMRAALEDMADRVREYRRDYYEMRWNARYGQARAVTDQAIADGANAQGGASAAGGAAAAAEEKKTFIRRCLRDGCQGFLSTAWKCGLCEWYSCGACLTVKGETRDSAHECKKEDVETAELIRKDSKSCPNCGQYIQKSSGCSQMFCISCQTPFDWETGKIVTKGAIHNPHYYEWMARNGGIPRNPQDIPCGGYPNAWDLYRVQPRSLTVRQGPQWTHFVDFHRICMDIQDLGARSYRSHMDQGAVQELHVQFLLGDMTEEQWGRRLAQLEKKRKRDAEIQEVFAAFHMVAVDMVARVTRHEDHQTSEDWRMRLRQWEEEMIPFLDMINDAFRVISRSYAYATPTICTEIDPHTLQRFYMMRTHNVMAPRKTVANVGGESATSAGGAVAESDSDLENI